MCRANERSTHRALRTSRPSNPETPEYLAKSPILISGKDSIALSPSCNQAFLGTRATTRRFPVVSLPLRQGFRFAGELLTQMPFETIHSIFPATIYIPFVTVHCLIV